MQPFGVAVEKLILDRGLVVQAITGFHDQVFGVVAARGLLLDFGLAERGRDD